MENTTLRFDTCEHDMMEFRVTDKGEVVLVFTALDKARDIPVTCEVNVHGIQQFKFMAAFRRLAKLQKKEQRKHIH